MRISNRPHLPLEYRNITNHNESNQTIHNHCNGIVALRSVQPCAGMQTGRKGVAADTQGTRHNTDERCADSGDRLVHRTCFELFRKRFLPHLLNKRRQTGVLQFVWQHWQWRERIPPACLLRPTVRCRQCGSVTAKEFYGKK